MPKIIQLDPHLANLIAAGEVVERPASVVKELVENAIDAGAKTVTVELQNGGISFLRVSDDGCGMSREDARTAFLRHATSKLRTQEDLAAIGTLGFRGEALAATAAVSRVELLTRTREDLEGSHLTLEGGKLLSCQAAGCPVGTTIVVRDLFFNTPARMKFMKRDTVEGSAAAGALQKQALAHPEISFRLIKDGETQLQTPGDGDLLAAIYAVLGRQAAGEMVPVDSRWERLGVSGYVSRPTATRGNRANQIFFVNRRYIRSRTLTAALEEAYRNQLMTGRFPSCVLNIDMPLTAVDVNVHPAKTEVKFLNEKEIFDCVHYGVLGALNKTPGQLPFVMQEATGQATGNRQQATGQGTGNREQGMGQGTGNREQGTGNVGAVIGCPPETSDKPPLLAGHNSPGDCCGFDRQCGSWADATGNNSTGDRPQGRWRGPSDDRPAPKETDKRFFKAMSAEEYRKAAKPQVHTVTRWEYEQMTKTLGWQPMPEPSQALRDAVRPPSLHGPSLPMDDEPESLAVGSDALIAPVIACGNDAAAERQPEASGDASLPDPGSIPLEGLEKAPEFRYIGEVFRTYILVEQEDQLILIDKHAAHERINFERLLAQGTQILGQTLLEPRPCGFAPEEAALLLEHRALLLSLGYDLDDLGQGDLLLRQIPSDIRESDAAATLSEIAEHLRDGRLDSPQRLRDEALHTIACKAAIKAGYITDPAELKQLAAAVLTNPNLKYCPHGRPICTFITKRQVEKQFKRIT
ncbi:MAG: DNA mismatch repair endonuclease MutL [Oscillospiraceae bacterium]|nr:DNA mismatch repair endonuclease MutL [Oscillospiraceae bacterium]